MFTEEHIGRTVYDPIRRNLEGKIEGVSLDKDYPIKVRFGLDFLYYCSDGRYSKDNELPTLSFTPYTLEGYTNTPPRSLPEVGEQILVSDNSETWFFEIFVRVEENGDITVSSGHSWKCYKRIKEIE